jgi:pimeloyl-ACP methyl ester carboxylesterase
MGRTLVMLHGFGATRGVFDNMLAENRWEGRVIAPDLRGHGQAPWGESYGLGAFAADVADQVLAEARGEEITVFGHSMGGAVALALASGWFGFTPARVAALGVKVVWSADELAMMKKLAAAPSKRFETEEAAIERFLKVSGLFGLVDAGSLVAKSGVVQDGDAWRLTADPAAASVGAPPFDTLIPAARCPIKLAAGEHDPMSKLATLREWDGGAAELRGLGHNAMVESPATVWDWLLT